MWVIVFSYNEYFYKMFIPTSFIYMLSYSISLFPSLVAIDNIIIIGLHSVKLTLNSLQIRKKPYPSYLTQWLYRLLSFLNVTIILFFRFVYMHAFADNDYIVLFYAYNLRKQVKSIDHESVYVNRHVNELCFFASLL